MIFQGPTSSRATRELREANDWQGSVWAEMCWMHGLDHLNSGQSRGTALVSGFNPTDIVFRPPWGYDQKHISLEKQSLKIKVSTRSRSPLS